ncbi:MAG: BfmA/BtgA family mobilization protein [Sedimentibacter sp.]|uniref:BfmA/BtgA family mobilization protein n=1 Tax=Sedimentibacter sp. TaxID=1960295 RepID=UPI0029812683|nr:BfmA/BtgA family mobilization protein [Sedimentibacter sp.]MDW5299086.1 BfmA/BtgA family mobilization protein [Sedimentibacter sp.]
MAKYETLNSNSDTKITIARLAKKIDMSLVDFLDAMAKYFEVTGVNPKDQVILSPTEELKKFRETIVSFMRKQENDFIKPTFGKMDTLIARFIKYIEEEAPKSGDVAVQNKMKSVALSSEIINEEKKGSAGGEAVKSDVNSDKYKELQEKLIKSELKLKTTRGYLENILSHTEYKITGIERKPIIELPMGDINEYKKYLKTL